MSNDLFIRASRQKTRFKTTQGALTVEDLWDLSLDSLDRIAVALDETIQKAGKKSFIGKRDRQAASDELAFEIVKHVIDTKIAESEAAKLRAVRRGEREFLEGLLRERQTEELKGLQREEIEARLKNLADTVE